MPQANAKPKYPIPWIATYFIAAFVLIAGSFAIVWFIEQPTQFDYTDPDVAFLECIVLSPDPRQGDFTGLNGGQWRALCLVGKRGDLNAALTSAKVEDGAARAIMRAHDGIASQVGETAFALVYADGQGTARAVHHPHGFAFARAKAAACTNRVHPVLALPVSG